MNPNQKWRVGNPEKYHTHMVVAYEIKKGAIKPQPCEICGNTENTHAHHEDYNKPLEINWLCTACHRILHAKKQGQKIHTEKPKYILFRPHHKHWQPAPKRDKLLNEAQILRDKGKSYKQIAQQLNISKGTVYKWLNDVKYK